VKKQTKKNQQSCNSIAGFSMNPTKTNMYEALIMAKSSKCVTTRKAQITPPKPSLTNLLKYCRTPKERKMMRLTFDNPGILTHEFGDKFGCNSNNHHLITRDLNPRLIRNGWVITKYHAGYRQRSWRWYIEPVYLALVNPIRKDLRITIFKYMNAANDE
jgi:hypothetical protein